MSAPGRPGWVWGEAAITARAVCLELATGTWDRP